MPARENRRFPFVANATWLDFVNTEVVSHGEPRDLLHTVHDLVAWSREANGGEAAVLRRLARGAGGATLRRALALRHSLRTLAVAATEGQRPSLDVVHRLNEILARTPLQEELVERDGRIVRLRRPASDDPVYLLSPVAISAAEFLVNGDPRMVKQCGAPDCILFFYDTTKNHRRRWCSMAGCGNRVKAAAFQRRQRST